MSRLPSAFLQCLLALGSRESEKDPILWSGCGILYGYIPPKETVKGYPYIVTNRHVLADLEVVYLRLNPATPRFRARHFAVPLLDRKGRPTWCGHPDPEIDIAVVPFDFDLLRLREQLNELILNSRRNGYRLTDLRANVSEGDEVFVLGFPLGAVGSFRNAPVVRRGCVAQIQELYSGHNDSFLVDAEVFPGNSGGPVILAPRPFTPWDQSATLPMLIGLTHSYLAYQDVATSDQTGQTRVIFEENTGLTQVYPVDRIDEAIRAHLGKRRRSAPSRTRKPSPRLAPSLEMLTEEAEKALRLAWQASLTVWADPGERALELPPAAAGSEADEASRWEVASLTVEDDRLAG